MKAIAGGVKNLNHHWKVLGILAVATITGLAFAKNIEYLLLLMINAYALTAFSAMLNRSSTRNSWVYHGAILLVTNIVSYWVFQSIHAFISANGLTYIIALSYITSTVWGNFTGSKISIGTEKLLGVKTKSRDASEALSREEISVKYILLTILGLFCAASLIVTRSDYLTAALILGLNFLNSGIHTFVRRSRNAGHTLFHNLGLLAQGLNFFFLFRFLASENMSWIFFLPFATGGILGGLFTHKFMMLAEKMIKMDPDAHLSAQNASFLPKKLLVILLAIASLLIWRSEDRLLILFVIGLSIAQYVTFTLISRARTRKNRNYEAYSAICSNGTWLATFGNLDNHAWEPALFPPYMVGVIVGGNMGMAIAMHIERRFAISSD